MSIIRQESLFTLEELFDLEPTHRFEEIFSAIDIYPILAVVSKKSVYGADSLVDGINAPRPVRPALATVMIGPT